MGETARVGVCETRVSVLKGHVVGVDGPFTFTGEQDCASHSPKLGLLMQDMLRDSLSVVSRWGAGLFCSGGPANFPIESNAPANDSKKDIFDVMPEHSSCCLCSGALSNKPQFQGCLVSERFHFY